MFERGSHAGMQWPGWWWHAGVFFRYRFFKCLSMALMLGCSSDLLNPPCQKTIHISFLEIGKIHQPTHPKGLDSNPSIFLFSLTVDLILLGTFIMSLVKVPRLNWKRSFDFIVATTLTVFILFVRLSNTSSY